MQETCNNCFKSKKRSMTLLQEKTDMHGCWTLLLHFGTCAYLFSPEGGSCYVFSTQNNCCKFLASDGVTFQNVIKLLSLIFWYVMTNDAHNYWIICNSCIFCGDFIFHMKQRMVSESMTISYLTLKLYRKNLDLYLWLNNMIKTVFSSVKVHSCWCYFPPLKICKNLLQHFV